jgi:hypothetical protein
VCVFLTYECFRMHLGCGQALSDKLEAHLAGRPSDRSEPKLRTRLPREAYKGLLLGDCKVPRFAQLDLQSFGPGGARVGVGPPLRLIKPPLPRVASDLGPLKFLKPYGPLAFRAGFRYSVRLGSSVSRRADVLGYFSMGQPIYF